jgi:hypothetical protein
MKTTQHFSSHATLAALGIKIRSLHLFEPIEKSVRIFQKSIKHQPIEKLKDAFIAILAGAHGLSEINTRLRSDVALQRAFGRESCAEQSVVQRTLDACTQENVTEMRKALTSIFRTHSRSFRHKYSSSLQLLDVDITGLPCGPKAALSKKGYFSKAGIRYGRQLGRVVATDYEETVVDHLFAGDVQLNRALRALVEEAEEVLRLDNQRRLRTVLRMDAGGGSLHDINWLLERGYQVHCKDVSSQRAGAWAATVEEWFDDPHNPDRQFGWVPSEVSDYIRPVRRLAVRLFKRNGQTAHALLISTLEPSDVMALLGRPQHDIYEPELVIQAYAQFYDQRGGTIEIEFKEDKQGFGMTKRRKRRAEAQQMVIFLNALAHNVLVWARSWLSKEVPQMARFGALRFVRDVLQVGGLIKMDRRSQAITSIVLNKSAPLARKCAQAWRLLLEPMKVRLRLGTI